MTDNCESSHDQRVLTGHLLGLQVPLLHRGSFTVFSYQKRSPAFHLNLVVRALLKYHHRDRTRAPNTLTAGRALRKASTVLCVCLTSSRTGRRGSNSAGSTGWPGRSTRPARPGSPCAGKERCHENTVFCGKARLHGMVCADATLPVSELPTYPTTSTMKTMLFYEELQDLICFYCKA